MSGRVRWRMVGAGLLVVAGCAWYLRSGKDVIRETNRPDPPHRSRPGPAKPPQPPIGAEILKHYADPAAKPEEDLTWMSRALDNFSLLVKGDDPLPLGANEDIADALRGKNKARIRFLPDDSPVFDEQGRIIDRWGTPLYFHASARDRLEIRSAGPDRQMWTADDLHRRQDGTFLRGDALLAPSLFEAKPALEPRR
jgi:hypothetical protein